jgi:hypothetical protein
VNWKLGAFFPASSGVGLSISLLNWFLNLTDYLLIIDLLMLILLDKACPKAVFFKFSLVPKASNDSFFAYGQQAITHARSTQG